MGTFEETGFILKIFPTKYCPHDKAIALRIELKFFSLFMKIRMTLSLTL